MDDGTSLRIQGTHRMIYLSEHEFTKMLTENGLNDFSVQVKQYDYNIVSRELTLGQLVDFVQTLPLKITPITASRTWQGYAAVSFAEMVK